MPNTPVFNLPYPAGSTNLTPLHTHFASLATATESALVAGLAGAPRLAYTDAERTSIFPAPIQGNSVLRPDKGYTEQYFATYNASSNPLGATPAGWYPILGTMPEVYIPFTGTENVADNSGHSFTTALGTPRLTPSAAQFFTVDNSKVITFNRSCEVSIEFRCDTRSNVNAASGSGKVVVLKNNAVFAVAPTPSTVMAEDEVVYLGSGGAFRQWLTANIPHVPVSTGDVLRIGGAANNVQVGEIIFGNTVFGTSPASFYRVVVTGPRRG